MSDLGPKERKALRQIIANEAGDDPTPEQAAALKAAEELVADIDGSEEGEEE